jgi:hypothetical protein
MVVYTVLPSDCARDSSNLNGSIDGLVGQKKCGSGEPDPLEWRTKTFWNYLCAKSEYKHIRGMPEVAANNLIKTARIQERLHSLGLRIELWLFDLNRMKGPAFDAT